MALAQTDILHLDRRSLLAASDELLDEVEELRLADGSTVPQPLRDAISALQLRIGRRNPPVAPATLRAAHELVLAVQQRLMAANPRNAQPRAHPGRAGGQPMTMPVVGAGRWKLLALPPQPSAGVTTAWQELVEATVERAFDRWAYAQHQAGRAARERREAAAALARARVAWANYLDLKEEADDLLRRAAKAASGAAPRA